MFAGVLAIGLVVSVLPLTAAAATEEEEGTASTVEVSLEQTTADTQLSGNTFEYSLSFTCSVLSGETCLQNGAIVIPLNEAATYPVEFPVTLPAGVLSAKVVAGEIVIALDAIGSEAYSLTMGFFLHSVNGAVNGTTWTLAPTVSGDGLAPVLGESVQSTVTSVRSPLSISMADRGDKTYSPGQVVSWILAPKCQGQSLGFEFPQSFGLVDVIPEGLEFLVDENPGWVYDETTRTAALTGLTPACKAEDGNQKFYELKTLVTESLEIGDKVTNEVTLTTNWHDGATSEQRAKAEIKILSDVDPQGLIFKKARGTVKATGDPESKAGWTGSYPGRWMGEPASYDLGIHGYGTAGSVEYSISDDVPCRTETPQGDFIFEGTTAGALCAEPAWHLLSIRAGLGVAESLPLGTPVVTIQLVDGSIRALSRDITYGWVVPADSVGKVARVLIDGAQARGDGYDSGFRMFGYPDASLEGGDVLRNVAEYSVSSAAWEFDTPSNTADLVILTQPQVDITKNASRVTGEHQGHWTVLPSVMSPRVLDDDIIITDLLPADVSEIFYNSDQGRVDYTNGIDVPVSVRLGRVGAYAKSTAYVEMIENFAGTGRVLVRWHFTPEILKAHPSFVDGPGFLFEAQIVYRTELPNAGQYKNDAGAFYNAGAQTDFLCPSNNQKTEDPMDLDGRPGVHQHCVRSATLNLPPGPGATVTRLVNEVKGDLDTGFMRNLAIGSASQHSGKAQYRLTWENRNRTASNNVVLYDIFPHKGDTGIREALASQRRGSNFATEFVSVEALPTGVSVEYSLSKNPCRDEVFSDTKNTGCVNDWRSEAPIDLSLVKALKFVSSETYGINEGFYVTVNVLSPLVEEGETAWNSVASAQSTASTGVALPSLEAPMVGLTRVAALSPALEVAKNEAGDDVTNVEPGDHPVIVTITNSGDDALIGFTFNDTTLSGADVVWSEEDLAAVAELTLVPGASATVNGTVSVDDEITHADSVSITAIGEGSGTRLASDDRTTLVPLTAVSPADPAGSNPPPTTGLAVTGGSLPWMGIGPVVLLIAGVILARRRSSTLRFGSFERSPD